MPAKVVDDGRWYSGDGGLVELAPGIGQAGLDPAALDLALVQALDEAGHVAGALLYGIDDPGNGGVDGLQVALEAIVAQLVPV